MKSLLVAVALCCSLIRAYPPLAFPFYGGHNSSTAAAALLGTASSSYTHGIIRHSTGDASVASEADHITFRGCLTTLVTTTVYVFAPNTGTFDLGSPTFTTALSEISTPPTGDLTYWFSLVDGTTQWSNGIAPPTDADIVAYSTSTAFVIPIPTDISSTEVTMTITEQRTRTSTIKSASTSYTETVVVTETRITTIHISLPASSSTPLPASLTERPSSVASPVFGPTFPPLANSTSISIFVENSRVSDSSTSSSWTRSSAWSSFDIPSNAALPFSSSDSGVTVIVTSSRTITLTNAGPQITGALNSNNGLSSSTSTAAFSSTSDIGNSALIISGPPISAPWLTVSTLFLPGTEVSTSSGSDTGPQGLAVQANVTSTSDWLILTPSPSVLSFANFSLSGGMWSTTMLSKASGTPFSVFSSLSTSSGLETTLSATRSLANLTVVGPVATEPVTASASAGLSAVGVPMWNSSFAASPTMWSNSTLPAALPSVASNNQNTTIGVLSLSSNIAMSQNTLLSTASEGSELNVTTTNLLTITTTASPFVFDLTSSSFIGRLTSNSTEAQGIVNQATSHSASASLPNSSPIPTNFTVPFTAGTVNASRLSSLQSNSTDITGALVGYGQAPPLPTPLALSNGSASASVNASCGEIGDFVMNWDDEPVYVQTNKFDPPYVPIFNPYHHLFFAKGFSYYDPAHSISQPEPYDPVSGPNVAIFHVNGSSTIADKDTRDDFDMLPGTIGAGPRANDEIYWFNAYSAELGCDNGGSYPCNMTISGYLWNKFTKQEQMAISQTALIQPCNQLEDCQLQHVVLNGFKGLSSIRFEAIVDGATIKSWVIDNLSLGWFNNTCSAGMTRISVKK